jgi:hypothetical protein
MFSVAYYHCRTPDGRPSFVNVFHFECGDLNLHYAIDCRVEPLADRQEFLIAVPRLSNADLELIDDPSLRRQWSDWILLEFNEGPTRAVSYACTLVKAVHPAGYRPILSPCTWWNLETDEDELWHEPVFRAPTIRRV